METCCIRSSAISILPFMSISESSSLAHSDTWKHIFWFMFILHLTTRHEEKQGSCSSHGITFGGGGRPDFERNMTHKNAAWLLATRLKIHPRCNKWVTCTHKVATCSLTFVWSFPCNSEFDWFSSSLDLLEKEWFIHQMGQNLTTLVTGNVWWIREWKRDTYFSL